jgi:hypothetical protein
MKLHVRAIGTRPLLMHNIQLASPLNKWAKAVKEISSKRVKTDEDRLAMAQFEFYGSLYYDDEVGPYIPGTMIFANLVEGAKVTKNGRKVERGLDVVELYHPLIYEGPRTMTGLWEDSNFVDMRSVRVGQARVDRTRPIFDKWEVEFDLVVDDEILNRDEVVRAILHAGTYSGFGDYRKMYGHYEAKVSDLE